MWRKAGRMWEICITQRGMGMAAGCSRKEASPGRRADYTHREQVEMKGGAG